MVYHEVDNDDIIGEQCNDDLFDRRALLAAFVSLNAISALLSIMGSSIIIYIIWSGRLTKLLRVQNRLIFCVSIIDIFNSVALGSSVLPIPKATCSFGSGNITTCTVQGFFIQLGMAVPGYMAMLSASCFLSIVRGVSESTMKRYELLMHAAALLPMLTAAIAGVVNKVYYSETGHCWVEETHCEENCHNLNLRKFGNGRWVVLATIIWVLFTTCIIFFSMSGIYLKIRKRAATMRRYEFQSTMQSQKKLKRKRRPNAIDTSAGESGKQAMLYICGYVLTYLWTGIHLCFYTGPSDVLYILTGIFLPLQGFWNFLVYIRPRFIAFRCDNPDLSVCATVKAVIFAAKNDNSKGGYLAQRRPRMRRRLTFNQKRVTYPAHQLASTVENLDPVHNSTTNDYIKNDDDDSEADTSSLFAEDNKDDNCSEKSLTQEELANIHKAASSFAHQHLNGDFASESMHSSEEEIDFKTMLQEV